MGIAEQFSIVRFHGSRSVAVEANLNFIIIYIILLYFNKNVR